MKIKHQALAILAGAVASALLAGCTGTAISHEDAPRTLVLFRPSLPPQALGSSIERFGPRPIPLAIERPDFAVLPNATDKPDFLPLRIFFDYGAGTPFSIQNSLSNEH